MNFKQGETYSRRQISKLLGGSIQAYLPTSGGRVVCGCFSQDPHWNPKAPDEVTFGEGPIVQSQAELVYEQGKSGSYIPIFLFRGASAWEYIGDYRCYKYSRDSNLLQQKMRENPKRGVIRGVLYFEKHP